MYLTVCIEYLSICTVEPWIWLIVGLQRKLPDMWNVQIRQFSPEAFLCDQNEALRHISLLRVTQLEQYRLGTICLCLDVWDLSGLFPSRTHAILRKRELRVMSRRKLRTTLRACIKMITASNIIMFSGSKTSQALRTDHLVAWRCLVQGNRRSTGNVTSCPTRVTECGHSRTLFLPSSRCCLEFTRIKCFSLPELGIASEPTWAWAFQLKSLFSQSWAERG